MKTCSGCAHEGTDGKKGLNKPSGERPCVICVRNPYRETNFIVTNNGVQIFAPKDMYVALDRLMLELQGLHTQHPWIRPETIDTKTVSGGIVKP